MAPWHQPHSSGSGTQTIKNIYHIATTLCSNKLLIFGYFTGTYTFLNGFEGSWNILPCHLLYKLGWYQLNFLKTFHAVHLLYEILCHCKQRKVENLLTIAMWHSGNFCVTLLFNHIDFKALTEVKASKNWNVICSQLFLCTTTCVRPMVQLMLLI